MEQPQLARDQGLELGSLGSGNRNWPARDQGTAPASSRPGNGIAQLGLGEQELASQRCDQGPGIGELALGEQARLARDRGLELASAGLENAVGSSRSGNGN